MSYILDALKRADAERERGAVPGLHSQSLATPVTLTPSGQRNALWLALAALAGIGAMATGVWLWSTPASQAPQAVEAARVPVPMPVTTASVAVVAPLPVVVAVAPPLVNPPVTVPTAPPLVPAKPAPAAKAVPSVATAKASAPAPVNIPLLGELPEELRRQIPALTITGAVYSETPANRLLLLNNLVLSQGSLAAPEVTLEEIRPKSSVFIFKGTRFRLAH